ncbi:MAG TPA: four helix bundle protein [Vicinamibacterales bacterium]|nr:four helix bundle protein [Vicinamibacterales bacterium]
MIHSFRDLLVWQKGLSLAECVYSVTEGLPRKEMYGLTTQMRRAAVSIPSNIAEGKGIGGRGYLRHLRIALGSEAELQTQIELAVRLKLLPKGDADKLLSEASEVGRMLSSLLKSLLSQTRQADNPQPGGLTT